MKKLLIFVIFIMFVFSPLSVVAVGDYGKNPDHPTPTPPTVTVAPTILDETPNKNKNEQEKARETIDKAPKEKGPTGEITKVIKIVNDAKIPSKLIHEATKSVVPVSFMNEDNTIAIQFKNMTVNEKDLRDLFTKIYILKTTEEKQNSTKLVNNKFKDGINKILEDAIFLQPKEHGQYGISMEISIEDKDKPKNTSDVHPFLYCVNEDGMVENQGVAISEDGWITFTISKYGLYIISYEVINNVFVNTNCENYISNDQIGIRFNNMNNFKCATDEDRTVICGEPLGDDCDFLIMILIGGVIVLSAMAIIVILTIQKKNKIDK